MVQRTQRTFVLRALVKRLQALTSQTLGAGSPRNSPELVQICLFEALQVTLPGNSASTKELNVATSQGGHARRCGRRWGRFPRRAAAVGGVSVAARGPLGPFKAARRGMAAALLLEIRRRTQGALLVIGEANLRNSPVDILITPTSLEVRCGEACTTVMLPAGIRAAPSSCRGLRYLPGEGLHLRLQVHVGSSAKLVSTLSESLKPRKCYSFYCQSCGDVIRQEGKFLRVLPLPSENWSALVEEWCCHPNPFARSVLQPRKDDCFLGDTFFLLNSGNESHVPESPSENGHHTSQSSSTLKSKENTRVICKHCKTVLGETVSSETTKYYVTEVVIQPSEESFSTIPRSQFIQSMIAQCLVEISSAKSTFRFSIKGNDGKVYILIWLLNSDTFLVESLGGSSSCYVFAPFGDTLKPDSGPVGAWNAVKVLYQPCIKSRNKDLADAWEDDIGVHPLTFPSETCLELLLILGLSTSSLPPSLRCMNSFQVAFLKM
ncbi:PREDICTED: E3 ubiquitin-protein ligase E3D [Tinamus guttatus]|uniref:E3 ubiquitin-protein ligase E3D n=1 Tax=Tinamus guttatus TaxID=94827 RepID=UPI00052F012F|nr:PREDICTED: E3 ubiquitin-protein ligase E3D [Tinamus guttatus]